MSVRVGVMRGDGVVARDGDTVLVVGASSAVSDSNDLTGRLIATMASHTGDARLRRLATLVLGESDPPAIAVAMLGDETASVFLLGDLDLDWPEGRLNGAGQLLGASATVPLAGGFGITRAGDPLPELAAWNDLRDGAVRGDGIVVSAAADSPAVAPSQFAAPESPPPDDTGESPIAPDAAPDPDDDDVDGEPTGPMDVVEPGPPAAADESFESISLTVDTDLSQRIPLPIAGDETEAPAAEEEGPAYERTVQVVGVYSPGGFFNHPDAKYCSRTGVKMGASHTKVLTTGPRPPLGVLTLDDGSTLTVRWNTLIGRDPELDERVQRGEVAPFVVSDEGQSVSRRHALLELVDWDVLISDLGSRNQTYIQTSPEAPRRPLASGERALLRSGMVVHIGDRSFVYNEHHVR